MSGSEMKQLLKTENIPYWRIADALGVHENTVLRKLRHNLTDADHKRFIEAVEAVKAEKKPSE